MEEEGEKGVILLFIAVVIAIFFVCLATSCKSVDLRQRNSNVVYNVTDSLKLSQIECNAVIQHQKDVIEQHIFIEQQQYEIIDKLESDLKKEKKKVIIYQLLFGACSGFSTFQAVKK